jgi:amicyanin
MRNIFIGVAAIAAVALAGCGSDDGGGSSGGGYGSAAPKTTTSEPAQTSTPAAPATAAKESVDIDIADFKYAPPAVAVKTGGSVTWTNSDSAAHTATRSSGKGMFDTDKLDKGQSKKITFSEPGTYAYICAFHPFMKGTVTVQ